MILMISFCDAKSKYSCDAANLEKCTDLYPVKVNVVGDRVVVENVPATEAICRVLVVVENGLHRLENNSENIVRSDTRRHVTERRIGH